MNLREQLRDEERATEAGEQTELLIDRVGRAFAIYHSEKPWVMDRIVTMVRRYRDAGRRRGIGFFFEVLRHEVFMESRDADGFKLNNNFRSRYVRLIEERHPELSGYFRKRKLRARL